jgi:hypothetical protein
LKLTPDELLSSFAFKFNLRRYNADHNEWEENRLVNSGVVRVREAGA